MNNKEYLYIYLSIVWIILLVGEVSVDGKLVVCFKFVHIERGWKGNLSFSPLLRLVRSSRRPHESRGSSMFHGCKRHRLFLIENWKNNRRNEKRLTANSIVISVFTSSRILNEIPEFVSVCTFYSYLYRVSYFMRYALL